MPGDATGLDERQRNEVDAIRQIYVDEFEALPDRALAFVVHLCVSDAGDAGASAALDVEFRLPSGYPDAAPHITVRRKKGISSEMAADIGRALDAAAATHLGTEMIFELVEEARRRLADVAAKKASIFEEMAQRKAEVQERAAAAAAEESSRLAPAIAALENRMAAELALKDERIRQAESAAEANAPAIAVEDMRPPESADLPPLGAITDIRPCFPDEEKRTQSAFPVFCSLGALFTGTASDGREVLLLRARFAGRAWEQAHGRRRIVQAVRELCELAGPVGGQCVALLGAALLPRTDVWLAVDVPSAGESLGRVLGVAGTLSVQRAVQIVQLSLAALEHIHSVRRGTAHGCISLGNIAVCFGEGCGPAAVVLGPPAVMRVLGELQGEVSAGPSGTAWRPPEGLLRGGAPGPKADVYALGVVALQLLFGRDFPTAHADAWSGFCAVESLLPAGVARLLRGMLRSAPHERLSAASALRLPVFSSVRDLGGFLWPGAIPAVRPSAAVSRYRADFEELSFAGRGAFGAVVKARNRVDGRVYAIKAIRLDPGNVEHNRRILREVTALSRLHHERIVRYYQAWIERAEESGQSSRRGSLSFASSSESESESESVVKPQLMAHMESHGRAANRQIHSRMRELYSTDASVVFCADPAVPVVPAAAGTVDSPSIDDSYSTTDSDHESDAESGTAPESDLPTDTESTSSRSSSSWSSTHSLGSSTRGAQWLYLQMEYCANQSLRDVIDAGALDVAEAWRLFRQIVEGLAHVHAQGMIHRDLKPGNIFLDTNGDVKIGDFGLAVGDDPRPADGTQSESRPSPSSSPLSGTAGGRGESLTGGIGTPFYVSPEQAVVGSARYNHKVDMYSLGVVLLELMVPFGTGMERAAAIRAARMPQIVLPDALNTADMARVRTLLRLLLDHDARRRPSCEELLRPGAELLPPKAEDEHVAEAIRTATAPGEAHVGRLLRVMFSRAPDASPPLTFDYNAGTECSSGCERAEDAIRAAFRLHGASRVSLPIVLPSDASNAGTFIIADEASRWASADVAARTYSPAWSSVSVPFLCEDGLVVSLMSDHAVSFARSAVRGAYGRGVVRRYVISPTYVKNPAGGQPRHVPLATFAVFFPVDGASWLVSDAQVLADAECARVACEAVAGVLGHTLDASGELGAIRLSSAPVLAAVLCAAGVSIERRPAVVDALVANMSSSWTKLRSALAACGVAAASLDVMERLRLLRDLPADVALRRLHEVVRPAGAGATTAVNALGRVAECAARLCPRFRVAIDVLCVSPMVRAACGTVFALVLDAGRRRTTPVAAGGCFRSAAEVHRVPGRSSSLAISVSAVSVDMERLFGLGASPRRVPDGLYALADAPVAVGVDGDCVDVAEALSVLWGARLPVSAVCLCVPNPAVRVSCTRTGNRLTLRVTCERRRIDEEVILADAPAAVRALLDVRDDAVTHAGEDDVPAGSAPAGATHAQAPISLTVLGQSGGRTGKNVPKSTIAERAAKAAAPLLSLLSGGRPLDVIAVEEGVSRNLVHTVGDVVASNMTDDEARRAMAALGRDERDAADRLRAALLALRGGARADSRNVSHAAVYNYREHWLLLVSLV